MIHLDLMNKSERKAYDKVKAQVDGLNQQFKPGEIISLKKDDGSYVTDTIHSEFSIMSGQATAWLLNNGSYMAERVEKLKS